MNIYDCYKSLKNELNGDIPVILIKNIGINQIKVFNRKIEVFSKRCEQNIEQKVLTTYKEEQAKHYDIVYVAKNQKDAIDFFRYKNTLYRDASKTVAGKQIYSIKGIDCNGDIRESDYIPIFEVRSKQKNDYKKINELCNKESNYTKYFDIDYEMKGDRAVYYLKSTNFVDLTKMALSKAYFCKKLYDFKYPIKSNSDEQKFEFKFLDDWGGENVDNIKKYIPNRMKKEFNKNEEEMVK